jgi:hypothetical protein
MAKYTQTRIADHFVPKGATAIVSNLCSTLKDAATRVASSANGNVGSSPNGSSNSTNSGSVGAVAATSSNSPGDVPKNDNTWVYWLLGAVVIGGGIYLIHRYNKQKEEEKRKQN